ncbi:hypothetical protein BAY61_12735 [Prauserella marina]|uniref:Uncharacterized protein n=1 Tax=Prauserella marina TaxID=530584 RepID=A0A222VP72_9PSEU|nr:hypothetical protein [Prauserella marina]ASR35725.1 hypothetical protein BAY61_12735 [Prauserella marina]PWV84392.1 hypothetical protein DES30_101409 [Prauserella marina]SDC23733.1 hypothetical protein SAMN05421630_101928 [Prauserella marina]
MRRGVCVKCGGGEIYGVQAHSAVYQDLWLGGQTKWSRPSTYFLACAGCGYVERYVNADKLDELRKRGTPMSD